MSNPTDTTLREQLDEVLSWYYIGDENKYTSEAWIAHKAKATDQLEALCQEIAREAQIKFYNRLYDATQSDDPKVGIQNLLHEFNVIGDELTQKPGEEV